MWHEEVLCGLDFETTGVDVETDRIVTGCVARMDGSWRTPPTARRWLLNPGVDIPEGATNIHGISTAQAKEHGQDPAAAIADIIDMLWRALDQGVPIVGYNVSFDLTMLDREARRYSLPAMADLPVRPVIDAMVLDKHVDRYRKGSRKLTDVAAHYGVALDNAHEASADVWAATGVACRIGQRHQRVGRLSLEELHALQVEAKRDQDQGFADYLRKQAVRESDPAKRAEMQERAAGVSGHWPIVPYARQEALS